MDPASGDVAEPKSFNKGPFDSSIGAPDEAFASASVKIEATYQTPVEHHNAMEPHATLARWDGDRLTVWTATQGISGVHKALATFFKLEPEQVEVTCPFRGGRVRVERQRLAADHAGRDGLARREQARAPRADARADVHLQRLSPGDRAVGEARRRRGRHAAGGAPRRVHPDLPPRDGRVLGAGRRGDPVPLRLPEHRHIPPGRARASRTSDLHARPWRGARRVRDRERDGRAGDRAEDGSARAAAEELRGQGLDRGQAVREQGAPRVLRPGRVRLRLGATVLGAGLDAQWSFAGRLGDGDVDLSDQPFGRERAGAGCSRTGRRSCSRARRTSAPAPTR